MLDTIGEWFINNVTLNPAAVGMIIVINSSILIGALVSTVISIWVSRK